MCWLCHTLLQLVLLTSQRMGSWRVKEVVTTVYWMFSSCTHYCAGKLKCKEWDQVTRAKKCLLNLYHHYPLVGKCPPYPDMTVTAARQCATVIFLYLRLTIILATYQSFSWTSFSSPPLSQHGSFTTSRLAHLCEPGCSELALGLAPL